MANKTVKKVSLTLSKKELEVLIKWENIIYDSWQKVLEIHPELTSDDWWELYNLIDYKIYARNLHNEKSKERMQKYRSTPDGLKKSREASLKSAKKYYRRKKLEKLMNEPID